MRLVRFTGVVLLATFLSMFVTFMFSDPGAESSDDRAAFAREVTDAAAQMPGIGAAQAIQVAQAGLAVIAGIGLYLLLRRRAPGLGLGGLLMLVLWGVFSAAQGLVGAAMVSAAQGYVGGGLAGAGDDQTLELIRVLGRLHFGSFIASWAAWGLALLAVGYGLAWPARLVPRWLGGTGMVAGLLTALLPLALLQEIVFLAWFIGVVLTFGWLLVTGVWLVARARPIGVEAAVEPVPVAG